MRLTDARQLDALPEGAQVAFDIEEGVASVAVRRRDGWRFAGHGPAHGVTVEQMLPGHLLEATARTPEDLERLLPGAVLEKGDHKDEDGIWWGPGSEVDWDSQRMARSLPLAILHPGNPDDTKEA
ncbi:hypothetical protein [uncultured Arsenicicoccus sp.]|uniref:hypothetical protein n=1 Tax=uncultured Arsenicicoccus sp. TaxID=491339 RepID=UPI0025982D4C|nr:hypothetical protein [uncultured Arsenicicoccus sp.]